MNKDRRKVSRHVISPRVSVIIANYNGKDFLCRCLDSVFKNSYDNYEVIVVDNGSTDGTVSSLREKFRENAGKIKYVELERNVGPAKARNDGAKIARGEYLAFLDNDTQVDTHWMGEALKIFEGDREVGSIQCKLLLAKERDRYDYAGEYLGQNGFLLQRARHGEIDKGQYDQQVELLAAKSAGAFIRKDVFDKAGGCDDDYFIYMEETDLGWRSWLAGYKTVFCPASVVYHEFGTSGRILSREENSFNIRFHGTKNYIMTLIKNLSARQMIVILPRHLFIWFCFALFLIGRGNFRSGYNVVRGICWDILHLPEIVSKRHRAQSLRKISDTLLFEKVMRRQPLGAKIKQFFISEKRLVTPENS